ncbi:proprotein convertase P-domain-containing protein [Flavobacterium sp. 3HN19-14]|uniref:proprotein convertase P-domain-containing protein n=1 Tax=Flavobacterium sp. 3HN19-14 TaxID=3448133 RepID=UPI003EE3BD09
MTVNNLNAVTTGSYTIAVTSTAGDVIKTANFYLGLGLSPVILTTPANNTENLPVDVNLVWASAVNAVSYDVEVATDIDFTNLVSTTQTTSTNFTAGGLTELTDYYWRVKPKNTACDGVYSAPNKFRTGHIVCTTTAATNVPVTISANTAATVTSTLNIPAGVTISDINAYVKINHSYVSDLVVTLVSPAGTQVQLFSGLCDDKNNVNATFDDAGGALVCGTSSPVISGTVRPLQPLSALIGQSSTGTWTLKVQDTQQGDGGSLTNWSLNICAVEMPLGVTGNNLFNFAVYPNPNNGTFNIQSDKLASDKINVAVYDMRGRIIFENNYAGSGNFNENIKLQNAQAGIYMLSVSDGENKEVKRIVVQ